MNMQYPSPADYIARNVHKSVSIPNKTHASPLEKAIFGYIAQCPILEEAGAPTSTYEKVREVVFEHLKREPSPQIKLREIINHTYDLLCQRARVRQHDELGDKIKELRQHYDALRSIEMAKIKIGDLDLSELSPKFRNRFPFFDFVKTEVNRLMDSGHIIRFNLGKTFYLKLNPINM